MSLFLNLYEGQSSRFDTGFHTVLTDLYYYWTLHTFAYYSGQTYFYDRIKFQSYTGLYKLMFVKSKWIAIDSGLSPTTM